MIMKSHRLVKISKRTKVMHFDLTTRCMLKCVFCAKASASLKPNVDFDISLLDKLPIEEAESILLCGRTGEPTLYPKLFDFIEICKDRGRNLQFNISTNGMLNRKGFWKKLSDVLIDTSHSLIFCIDGLEDTLPIYRKGADFNQITSNALEFIKGGGSAIWKFIVFHHNEHQMEQIEKLSNSMGFKEFMPILSYHYNDVLKKPTKYLSAKTKREQSINDKSYIHCRMEEPGEFFITYNGYIIPCCLMSPDVEDSFFENIQKLNLSDMTFEEMRSSDYFNRFIARISFFDTCSCVCRTSMDVWSNIDREEIRSD